MTDFPRGAAYHFGSPDRYEVAWGLAGMIGYQVGAIITYAGSIERYLELAIWRLSGLDPKGIRPPTDAVDFTRLLQQLSVLTNDLEPDLKRLVSEWIKAAGYGAMLRNNIAHGVVVNVGGATSYMRNVRWHGEERKREFGDTWLDQPTGDMLRGAFATLLKVISQLALSERPLVEIATPLALRAVREARSMLAEFSNAKT